MPYASIADLPAPVQKLDAELQKQWLEVFNSIMDESDGDEERAFAGAWAVVNKRKCAALAMVVKTAAAVSVLKGDVDGHPFRGNQYQRGSETYVEHETDSSAAVINSVRELSTHFKVPAKLHEHITDSFVFATENHLKLLRDPADAATFLESFSQAVRSYSAGTPQAVGDALQSVREASSLTNSPKSEINSDAISMAYILDGAKNGVAKSSTLSEIKSLARQMKGDSPGHPFRGNQFVTPEGLDTNSRAAGLPAGIRELIAAKRERDQAAAADKPRIKLGSDFPSRGGDSSDTSDILSQVSEERRNKEVFRIANKFGSHLKDQSRMGDLVEHLQEAVDRQAAGKEKSANIFIGEAARLLGPGEYHDMPDVLRDYVRNAAMNLAEKQKR